SVACALFADAAPLRAQDGALRLEAEPASVEIEVGSARPIRVTVRDASGAALDVPVRFAAPRAAVQVRDGEIRGLAPGSYEVVATAVLGTPGVPVPSVTIPVTVRWPAI